MLLELAPVERLARRGEELGLPTRSLDGDAHNSTCPPALATARRGAFGCCAILDIGRLEKVSGGRKR
jgi:hypothetical protein